MANLTKKQKHIVEMYVRYFGTVATEEQIKSFDDVKSLSKITADIRKDADNSKTGFTPTEFLNDVFQNLFGRDANPKDLKYVKTIENNKNLPIATIIKNGSRDDKAVYNTKKLVAQMVAAEGGSYELDNITPSNYGSIYNAKKGLLVTTIAELEAKIVNVEGNINGKTFVLTESVDAGKDFTGTTKNDLFIADNSTKTNASAADTLDGGKGEDTFKLYDDAAGAGTTKIGSLPTLKNIENVVIYDNQGATLNVTKWDTVETLFLVNSVAATTNLGEKVTTVNLENNNGFDQTLDFNAALTAATVGVNNVTNGGTGVTVTTGTGTALKTLTVDAYGKKSTIDDIVNGTIETLNINGKADLTLTSVAGLTAVKTVDGSKAEGKLVLDLAAAVATLKTVKTGTGDDTVTLDSTGGNRAVTDGTTIDLGAGNDKLLKGTSGSVATSTTTVIDGGAGIDSLDSALVTVGNAGVFANFETLSLTTTTTTPLDLDLLTKSTITSIAKDNNAAHTLLNVKKSQSLTINTSVANATTLTFKASEVAGTADAYTINFDKETTGATFDANIVTIDGIETVTVNSLGKTSAATDTNKITLKDADAKSLVITGDKNIELVLGTAANEFGTAGASGDGKGVATIDASASTAGIKITTLANTGIAENGLTIKGGAGADSITTGATAKALTIETGAGKDTIDLSLATTATDKIIVNAGAGDDIVTLGATGGTFTLGAGKDTIIVKDAEATGVTVATGAIKTTITDIEKGDKITFTATGTFTQATISVATDLDSALVAASNNSVAHTKTWFQYAGNTYIVDNVDGTTGIDANNDVIVKLNGLVDLSNSSLSGTDTLTIA